MVGWEAAVPTIKRVMDAAIVVMVVVDLVLTGVFFSRGGHPPQAPSRQQAAVVVASRSSAATESISADNAPFLLLRGPGAGDAQEVFTCPSADAQKWDYGGGANTAQNWANWNSATSTTLVNESYSYENPFPASELVVGSSSTKP